MIKNVLRFALAIVACGFLVSPREASANTSGFPNWEACDEYMFHAHAECIRNSHKATSGVTEKMCEDSWEVTCAYCDTNYNPYGD